MRTSEISRRDVLRAGSAAGVATALGLAGAGSASALPALAPSGPKGTEIVDLGPAVVQYSLMSAKLIGDTLYIGSRNLEPARVIAFHLPTQKVVAETTLAEGHTIQALAADPDGRYLYAGVLKKSLNSEPNLFRWDVTTPQTPAVAIGKTSERNVRALSVSPDGHLFIVGDTPQGAPPALWEWDPATGNVSNLGVPDPGATLARTVAATDTTVFFGAGSTLGGGSGASRACLYAYDRAAKTFTLITPAEMEVDPSIRDLAVFGDKLVVGSAASTEESKVAAIDLNNLSSYSVATSIGTTAKNFAIDGDKVYFGSTTGLVAYSLTENAVSAVEFDGLPALGGIWGVEVHGGKVLVVSDFGFVASIDTAAETATVTDLADAGATGDPQTTMGLAAGAGYVFIGGNGVIAKHRLGSNEVVNMSVPGEAKDAIMVRGRLYTAQYSSQGIWTYNPRSGDPMHQVAGFPTSQNRPQDVHWDEENRLVLAGVQSDTEGGGALWTYNPYKGTSAYFLNPIDDQQYVRAVATHDGVAYLGGSLQNTAGPGTIVAFDPRRGKELWRLEPGLGGGVSALAVRGKHLYGLTRTGVAFVIDLPKRRLIHQENVSGIARGFAAMVTNRGVVYGVSDHNVFRFDPKTFAVTVVVADVDGGWYSGAHITNDEQGFLYTLRGRNLVQINDHPRR
ncbi:hypothetical protein GCM10027403_36980 [Arthrobacter tecti]